MTQNELITALQNAIININDVQNKEDMKKQGLLEKYNIDEIKRLKGADNRFYVKIPDSSYSDGYKTIKGSSKEDVFTKLEKYDAGKEKESQNPSFKNWFYTWKERQSVQRKRDPKTIEKYQSQYERVFSGTKIENWVIDEIDSEVLESFLLERYKEVDLPRKACKNINCMIRGMFDYARIKRKVDSDITKNVDWAVIVDQCEDKKKDESWKTVTPIDKQKFSSAYSDKVNRDPSSLVPYCALFVTLTGVRSGEAVAITLDDISNNTISINKSEKTILHKGEKTTYYIGDTKNKKTRIIPLTDEVIALINKVMDIRRQYNFRSKYLFCRENGNTEWVSTPQVRDWLRRNGCKCMQAMRATLSAELKKNGISPYVVSSLLGHSVRVNATNYSPNVISIEEKREALRINNRKTV